jgi:hypothetical protein
MGQHRWSGWPGAHCMYCGAEDPTELALADNWINFDENMDIIWDTEEHKKEVEILSNNCPIVPDGVDPYSLPFPSPSLENVKKGE